MKNIVELIKFISLEGGGSGKAWLALRWTLVG